MILDVFILLFVFQIKHLLADYYWQFPYMYLNKGSKYGWFEPLLMHSMVHAGLTAIILGVYFNFYAIAPSYGHKVFIASAVLFDLVTHFITDRWKATRGKTPKEREFWTNLGIDQMIHHIVGIIIIFGVVIYI